ncbi:MAG: zinc-dependent metalloprotease [Actinobacteria bacterium]|nr:zinc-dependent metalloprotease [Actinomycetota bacterium]
MGENGMGDNPFGGLPFFGDMMKAMAGQGPLNWDIAQQFAVMGTSTEGGQPNVDPAARIAIEQLIPIAVMHVGDVLGDAAQLSLSQAKYEFFTPAQWCHSTLNAYKPLFNELATALGQPSASTSGAHTDIDLENSDPMSQMMRNLASMMAPSLLGMTIGSMIGHAVLQVPHIRQALLQAVERHVKAFRPDPSAAFERMTHLEVDADNPMAALQHAFSQPEITLGAVISPEQEAMMPALDALLATLVGVIDWTVDTVAQRVLGGAGAIAEAVRRRRIEESSADVFVEHLLGVRYTRAVVSRGKSFVAGVIERSSPEMLLGILANPSALPTPAEVDAPGLWLARLECE